MSQYQPKGEAQLRRGVGKSGGGAAAHHQRAGAPASSVKGGGAPAVSAAPVQSSIVTSTRSVKRSNGAANHSRGTSPAGLEHSDNHRLPQHQLQQQHIQLQPAVQTSKQPPAVAPISNGAVSRSSRPGTPSSSSAPKATEPMSPVAKTVGAGELPLGTVPPPLSFQFGSISPGFMTSAGVQIPARTSSAPPNIDEQKRQQAWYEGDSAAIGKVAVIPSGGQKQLPRQDVGHGQQPSASAEHVIQSNRILSGQGLGPPMQSSAANLIAGVPQVSMPQSQGHQSLRSQLPQTSSHVLTQPAVTSQAHLQVQTHLASSQQGLVQIPPSQTIQLQLQQSLMQQNNGQGIKLPQSIAGVSLAGQLGGPPLPTRPGQISHPQLSGALANQMPPGLPGTQFRPATNHYFQPRTSKAVKIVHPETHEELRFDLKTMKGDSFLDNGLQAATAGVIGNGPQSRPSLGYVGGSHYHMNTNFYHAQQSGHFTQTSQPFYQAPMPIKSGAATAVAGTPSIRYGFIQSQGQGALPLNPISAKPISSPKPASPCNVGAEPSGNSVAAADQSIVGNHDGLMQSGSKVDVQVPIPAEEKSHNLGKSEGSPAASLRNVPRVLEHNQVNLESSVSLRNKDDMRTVLSVCATPDVKQIRSSSKKKKKKDSSKADAISSGDSNKVHKLPEDKKQPEEKITDTSGIKVPAVNDLKLPNVTVVKAQEVPEGNVMDVASTSVGEVNTPEATLVPTSSSGDSEVSTADPLHVEPAGTSMGKLDVDEAAADVQHVHVALEENNVDILVAGMTEASVLLDVNASLSDLNPEPLGSIVDSAHGSHNMVELANMYESKPEDKQDVDKAAFVIKADGNCNMVESGKSEESKTENKQDDDKIVEVTGELTHLQDNDQGAEENDVSLHPLTATEQDSNSGVEISRTTLEGGVGGEVANLVSLSDGPSELTSEADEGSHALTEDHSLEKRMIGEGDAVDFLADSSTDSTFQDGALKLDEAVLPRMDSGGVYEQANMVEVTSLLGGSNKGGYVIDSSVSVASDIRHGSKKKKMKDILAKADAAGTTADLYNAYKAPEEKKDDEVRVSEVTDTKVLSTDAVKPSVMPEEKAVPRELDDWEDAAELTTDLTATTAVDSARTSEMPGSYFAGREKYTRDFLLRFKDKNRELPSDFEIRPDIFEVLTVEREMITSSARMLDRQHSGGPRRGNVAANSDEDRWTRPSVSLYSPGYSETGHAEMGPAGSFRPGNSQGLISRMPSNVRLGIPMPPLAMGLIPGKPLVSPIDADRWQRLPAGQKGLIPSPQTPLTPIHKAEKRYEIGKTSDEEEVKQRQVKGILNKLTPQNFEKLFAQVKEVNIESAITLKGVISQIFDKALLEPTFCETYAKFCVQLSVDLPEFIEDGDKVTFKRVLLNKCQEEFLRGEREQAEADIEEEDGEVKLTPEEREEKRVKAKRRTLGNVRFIGELYKSNMLTERIMHECIKKLLGEYEPPEEEDIEALCKLMSTIGHLIDHPKAKEHIDAYFDRMHRLSNSQKLSVRLRFMLRDAIDLRRNGWQERRKVEGPKKIDEVHRDAVQERHATVAQAGRLTRGSSIGGSAGRRSAPLSDFGMRGPASPMYSTSTPMGAAPLVGGFRAQPQIGSRGSYGQDVRLEDKAVLDSRPMLMPLSQRPVDEGPITLGPQGGLGRGIAMRGQLPGSGRSSLADVSATAIAGDGRRSGPGPLSAHAPGMLQERSSFGARDEITHRGVVAERPLTPSERPLLERPATLDRYGGSVSTSMPSGQQQGSISRPSTASASVPLTEDQLRERCEKAILEYFSARDLKEAALCVEDLRAPYFHSKMVFLWISISIDKKEVERDLLVKLLMSLYKTEPFWLKQDHIARGFEMVLESLEDLVMDVPKAPEYLARMLEKLITAEVISLDQAGDLLRTCDESHSGYSLDIFGKILECLRQERGETTLLELYESSRIRLDDFAECDDTERRRFLRERNLECLHPPQIQVMRLGNELLDHLNQNEQVSETLSWLQKSISPAVQSDPVFLQILMTQILKHCMLPLPSDCEREEFKETISGRLKKYKTLLQSFASGKSAEAKQSQYIAAIEVFIQDMDHPMGLMTTLFSLFYETKVISKCAYLNWDEDVKDSTAGRNKASREVQRWLSRLKTLHAETEDD